MERRCITKVCAVSLNGRSREYAAGGKLASMMERLAFPREATK